MENLTLLICWLMIPVVVVGPALCVSGWAFHSYGPRPPEGQKPMILLGLLWYAIGLAAFCWFQTHYYSIPLRGSVIGFFAGPAVAWAYQSEKRKRAAKPEPENLGLTKTWR